MDSIKEGAKSARAGLHSYRRQQADEVPAPLGLRKACVPTRIILQVRQARLAERERKKALADEMKRRNREVHDMLYASKVCATRCPAPAVLLAPEATAPVDAVRAARPRHQGQLARAHR